MRALESVLAGAVAAVIMCVAVGAGVALGIGFLLIAFYLYLVPHVGATAAAAATGGLGFLVAIVVVGLFALAIRIARTRAASRLAARAASPGRAGEPASGAAGTSAMMREAGGWIGQHPMAAGLGALSAGVVLGLNPELRRALADGISAWLRASRPRDEGSGGPGHG